jgi:hypothetical protein
MADFAVRQAERQVQVAEEIQQLKAAILPRLQDAEIARVEIRFDGCGDSGAIEECACLDEAGTAIPCPEVSLRKAKQTALIVPGPESRNHSGKHSNS